MFTPKNVILFTLFFCEAIGLFGLMLSTEFGRPFLLLLLFCSLVILLAKLRLSDKKLLWCLASIIFVSGIFPFITKLNISAVLPLGAVAMHTFLFASQRTIRNYYWRLGFAFMQIVLASILKPEAYMFFLIFAFILNCSLALSFLFLMQNFQQHKPEELEKPLSTKFLKHISLLSVLIFLSAFVIFPILPRSNWAGFGNSNRAEIGYIESISYQQSLMGWTQSKSKIVMQIFLPAGIIPKAPIFPYGLLRGKTLSVFNGEEWTTASESIQHELPESDQGLDHEIEVQREEINSGLLPLPYGAIQVSSAAFRNLKPQVSGEWVSRNSRDKSIRYRFFLSKNNNYFFPQDLPRPSHSRIPMLSKFARVKQLSAQLKKGTRNDLERLKKIEDFFDRSGLKAELAPLNALRDSPTHPIEEFLFEKKSGHCELFAASAALIARAMGMPSRVVVGFRFDSKVQERTIFVRNTDAHAWTEVWTLERGWVPMDLTPFTAYSNSWGDEISFVYDWVSLYWNRNILSYEFSWGDFRAQLPVWRDRMVKLAAIALFLILLFIVAKWLRKNMAAKSPREKIGRLYSKAWKRSQGRLPQETTNLYQSLRFGKKEPDKIDHQNFKKKLSIALKDASIK